MNEQAEKLPNQDGLLLRLLDPVKLLESMDRELIKRSYHCLLFSYGFGLKWFDDLHVKSTFLLTAQITIYTSFV